MKRKITLMMSSIVCICLCVGLFGFLKTNAVQANVFEYE